MSTFPGRFETLPGVQVDYFYNVEEVEVLFLSHCHVDHMRGLPGSCNDISTSKKPLYASPVSCTILSGLFPCLTPCLKELSLETANHIFLQETEISVSAIPAGHCPGSVMLLFESPSNNILYTGDYRVPIRELKNFKHFYSNGQLKTIDHLYLDTTFFLRQYQSFPSREESFQQLSGLITEWFEKNPLNAVKLWNSARFGYEYIFKEIYDKFKMPVHVNQGVFDFYKLIPELDKCVSTDPESTRIHSACGTHHKYVCLQEKTDFDQRNLKIIKLSATRFTVDAEETSSDSNKAFVCYATHASLEEGLDLLNFFKAKRVIPCVVTDKTKDELEELLEEVSLKLTPLKTQPSPIKLFQINEQSLEDSQGNDTNWKFDSLLDSPPRTRKRFN